MEQARRLGLPARERAALHLEYVRVAVGWEAVDLLHEAAREALELVEQLPAPTPADRELDAFLRALDAFLLFNLDRTDEARRILHVGLAALDDGPPTTGRASLLARLGWLEWRGGSVDPASGILERAVEEAQSSGAAEVERWATHDLGIARGLIDGPESGLALLDESMRQAKAANDVPLLMRCYINIPGILLSGGGGWERARELLDEGLALARRTMDRASEAWICWQHAELLEQQGRLAEARAWIEQAVELARLTRDPHQLGAWQGGIAWMHAYAGRWDEARVAWRLSGRDVGLGVEEQGRVYYEVFSAWERWQSDPLAAVEQLAAVLPAIRFEDLFGALFLARMAVRTGSQGAMAVALDCLAARARSRSPLHEEQARWVRTLAAGDPDGALESADRLRTLGALLYAALAYVDAALLFARRGRDAEAEATLETARELHERIGLVPVLGPLPETRWVAPAVGQTARSAP